MNHLTDGFLSERYQPTVELVKQRYSALRELLLSANKLAIELQHSIEINQHDPRNTYGAALFARTISSVQAATILLERGLVPQARTVLRGALEAFFALSAIAKKPETVNRLIDSHEAEQKRVAKNMRKWQHPELQIIAKENSELTELHLTSKANTISTYDLAIAGDNEDWYRTVYTVFSWSAHSASTDLERHLVLDKDGDITEFRNEPEIENQESSWSCGIELITNAIRALESIFANLNIHSLETLEEQHKQLIKEYSSNCVK